MREVALLPDPKDVEILRSGPRAWNAWRENNPSTVPDLAGIALSLSERQMGPINGGPINLKSARLQGAFLRFATLSAADLEAADMSDADFMHARFDRANLSAANLSNAQLDHADLSGATLTKVDLCGASLQHAILSTTDLQAADMSGADLMHVRLDRANLSAANLTNACLDYADFAGANLSEVNLCGASLQHAKNLTESQLKESTGSGSTILPPHLQGSVSWSVARTSTEIERQDFEPRAQLTAAVDVSHIGSHAAQHWGIGALCIGVTLVISAFVWQHMNEAVPLDTSSAQRGTPDQGDDSALVSADSPPAPSQHAIVPDFPAAAPIPEPQGPPATEQPAEALAVNTPEPSVPMITAPDLPAVAVATPEQPDPRAAEQPAEALSVNTPEQHLDASPPNYTALPPITAAPPSLDVTALPDDAEIVPKPFRKPVIQKPAGKPVIQKPTTAPPSVNVTALPNDAEIVPKPIRKPGIQSSATKPVMRKPVTKPLLPDRGPAIREANRNLQAGIQPQGKPTLDAGKKPQLPPGTHPKGAGRRPELRAERKTQPSKPPAEVPRTSATADVLAGGL